MSTVKYRKCDVCESEVAEEEARVQPWTFINMEFGNQIAFRDYKFQDACHSCAEKIYRAIRQGIANATGEPQ